ncbi:hypothetical protein ACFX13_032019 [Malus domestica]
MRRRRAIMPTSTSSLYVSNVGLIFTKGDLKEVNEEVGKYKETIICNCLLCRFQIGMKFSVFMINAKPNLLNSPIWCPVLKEPHLRVLLIRPAVCILKDHSQKHMECPGSASGEGASSVMPTFGSSWVEHRNDLVTALNLFLSPSGFATFRAPAACLHVPITISSQQWLAFPCSSPA